jgi:hypothetical protein
MSVVEDKTRRMLVDAMDHFDPELTPSEERSYLLHFAASLLAGCPEKPLINYARTVMSDWSAAEEERKKKGEAAA